MDRRELLRREGVWAGWVRTEPGVAGGWHHHGEHDSYIFVVHGAIAIDFGPGGRERVEAKAGEFVFNPARMIHREVTGAAEPVEAFVIRVGSGPLNINVESPDLDEAPGST
jgi:uncharacterized RmlC-like cupin family protein